jgi:hypothetical protein
MDYPTFDADGNKKRIKINIFKIGELWCFKYFFDDREVFSGLLKYYNRGRYRFEVKNEEEKDKIMRHLNEKGFELIPIEDTSDYTVKVDRYRKYDDVLKNILKNSIENTVRGNDRIFIMKDLASVEEAIEGGAERCS